jgi:hypothetical protein
MPRHPAAARYSPQSQSATVGPQVRMYTIDEAINTKIARATLTFLWENIDEPFQIWKNGV